MDGPVPSWPIVAAFLRERSAGRALFAIGAADFHDDCRHVIGPVSAVEMPRLGVCEFMGALRRGAFGVPALAPSDFRISATGEIRPDVARDRIYAALRCAAVRLRSIGVCAWRNLPGSQATPVDSSP